MDVLRGRSSGVFQTQLGHTPPSCGYVAAQVAAGVSRMSLPAARLGVVRGVPRGRTSFFCGIGSDPPPKKGGWLAPAAAKKRRPKLRLQCGSLPTDLSLREGYSPCLIPAAPASMPSPRFASWPGPAATSAGWPGGRFDGPLRVSPGAGGSPRPRPPSIRPPTSCSTPGPLVVPGLAAGFALVRVGARLLRKHGGRQGARIGGRRLAATCRLIAERRSRLMLESAFHPDS